MSEPPTSIGEPLVYPPFTAVETPDSGGAPHRETATSSGMMNPSGVPEARPKFSENEEGPFNIEIVFIGFTTRFTSLRRTAVFSGVPPVHQGFTPFTGGFTGRATPVVAGSVVANGGDGSADVPN